MTAAARIPGCPEITTSPELWEILDVSLEDVDGWALEDVLTPATWKGLLDDPAVLDTLESWTGHSDKWRRRAALIYALPYARQGHDPERVLSWTAG